MVNKDLITDWAGTFLNYFIISFIFIKALSTGSLDMFDIVLTIFGLVVSVFILVIKVINKN